MDALPKVTNLLPAEYYNDLQTAARLFLAPGQVAEIRALNPYTASGYFDNTTDLVKAVQKLGYRYDGIYITINPVLPDLLARSSNQIDTGRGKKLVTTSDSEITARRWIFVDLDPVRPSGISATEQEHQAALDRAQAVRDWLYSLDISPAVMVDSGNGAYVLLPIDLPNDKDAKNLIDGCLKALDIFFSDDAVKVDLTGSNAARIVRLPGTINRKGSNTAERPHRRARFVDVPDELHPVPRERLAVLAEMAPKQEQKQYRTGGGPALDVAAWLQQYGIEIAREAPWQGGHKWVLRVCPWNPDHTDRSAYIVQFANGAIAAGCHHNGCQGKGWRELRELYDGAKNELSATYDFGLDTWNQVDEPVSVPKPTKQKYIFEPAVKMPNFVSAYIGYASRCNDAPLEYHEALAFAMLACATPKVKAKLSIYPDGLGTNLYIALIGDSTRSRKSTSTALALHLLKRAIPEVMLPDSASPEALIEQLAMLSGKPSVLVSDEFAGLLDKMHHQKYMAGFLALLLTIYSGSDFKYTRHSKRIKGGATIKDEDWIREPHLSIMAAATPTIFSNTTLSDIETGLLPRFAIVMPEILPPRKPFYKATPPEESETTRLIWALEQLHDWAQNSPTVVFGPGALEAVDAFQADIENMAGEDHTNTVMLQRLGTMALKLAMLVACGRTESTQSPTLTVTESDALQAVAVARRWKKYAQRFAERVGESEFEIKVQRVKRMLVAGEPIERRNIARKLHLSKLILDGIQDTLIDRGEIEVRYIEQASGPAKVVWTPTAESN